MGKEWEKPRIAIQEFVPNEYVAVCWGVGCSVDLANSYENKHHFYNVSHAWDHCGQNTNQVIKDYNNDNVADAMIETGTDGLGDLKCTIYTDGQYSKRKNISEVQPGDYIFWTTRADDGRVWHHQGKVSSTVPGHPNRS